MSALPWKLLVIADLGISAEEPARLPVGAGWPDGISARIDLPLPNERGAVTTKLLSLAIESLDSFAPAAIRRSLSEAGYAEPTTVQIDAVLHHASFQRVESAWRGLLLLREQAKAPVELWVFSSSREKLVERFQREVYLEMTEPWSVILLDYDFSHKGADFEALTALARMAKVLKSPLVAGAGPALFDLRYFAHLPAIPNVVDRVTDAPHAGWRAYQASEEARWVSLTVNRYLQRAAYHGEHEETVEEAKPETFLFGRGSWLVGAAIARSVVVWGHALDIAGARGGRFDGLPTRLYPQAINDEIRFAAEAPFPEMRAMELTRAGVSPLSGVLRSDTVVLSLVNTTFQLMPGKLTLEALLAYQLTAGRLGQFCDRLLDRAGSSGASSPEELCAWIERETRAFAGPLAGEKPEEALTVAAERADAGDGNTITVAHLRWKPSEPLEGRDWELELLLPIGG